jgi:hypothetical protein
LTEQLRYLKMKATTPPETLEGFLSERIDLLIRQLPPEERSKISFEGGRFTGPAEIIRKVKSMARREDTEGPAGD